MIFTSIKACHAFIASDIKKRTKKDVNLALRSFDSGSCGDDEMT